MADARLALARALAPDPNYTYGNILPLAKNNQTGALSPAMPGMVRSGLQGLADLVNMRTAPSAQPGVNTLTPDSLGALMGMPTVGVAPAGAVASGAVRRAALPMDEASRMARAAEQGFGGDLFHGTASDFSAVKTRPGAFWMSDRPEIAGLYAKPEPSMISRQGVDNAGPNVMPLRLRGEVLRISDLGPDGGGGWNFDNLAAALGVDGSKYKHIRDLYALAKERGYSALRVDDVADLGGMQSQWQLLDPTAARSRFAAFDPAKKDSADLLASRSPGYPLAWQQQPQDQRRGELARALSKVQK